MRPPLTANPLIFVFLVMRLWPFRAGRRIAVEWHSTTATSPWTGVAARAVHRLHAYRVRLTVGWALNYSPPCPEAESGSGIEGADTLPFPMPHSHLECGRLFAGGAEKRVEISIPNMKWHTGCGKSIVRLGHNPHSGAAPGHPFPSAARASAGGLRCWRRTSFYSATEECWRCSGLWEASIGFNKLDACPLLPRWYCFTRNTSRCSQSSAVARRDDACRLRVLSFDGSHAHFTGR